MINHISVEEPTNHPNPDDKVWYFDFVQDIFYVYYEKKLSKIRTNWVLIWVGIQKVIQMELMPWL